MKHIFNTFALLAAALACLSLTACSKDDDSPKSELEGTWMISNIGSYDEYIDRYSDEYSFVQFKNGKYTEMYVGVGLDAYRAIKEAEYEIFRADYTVNQDVVTLSRVIKSEGNLNHRDDWGEVDDPKFDYNIQYEIVHGKLKWGGELYSKASESDMQKYIDMFSIKL